MSTHSDPRVVTHTRKVDAVAVRHPGSPGEVHVVPANQFASLSRNGWVEARSPAAKAAVETTTPTEGETPSKEGTKS